MHEILLWEDRKMRNDWFRKGLVVGIIVLFIGVGIHPAVAVNPNKTTNILQEEEDNNQEEVIRNIIQKIKKTHTIDGIKYFVAGER